MECVDRLGRKRRQSALPLLIFALSVGTLGGVTGCDEDGVLDTVGEEELSPPLGLRGITGNGQVTLIWFTSNFEDDFGGYKVFKTTGDQATDESITLPASFVLEDEGFVGSSSNDPQSVTIDSLANGTTYSFAVVAFKDDSDEISRTSNIIADTPRPDINRITLESASTADVIGDDTSAGFDFDGFTIDQVPPTGYVNFTGTDMVHEAFDPSGTANIRSWMAGMNGGGVQDLGFMADLDGSDVAPVDGYAGQGESVLLTVGHVYAVKTGEVPSPRYGKFIVTQIVGTPIFQVTFNAAFQTKDGDPNYFPALGIKP
jgi:hypothetical protein